jgi:hypothetical protein
MDFTATATPNCPWRGYTIVVSMLFESDADTGNCDLVLDLAIDHVAGSPALTVRFDGIVDLSLQHFGGGITQIMALSVRSVSDRQWDRQAYEVFDEEHGAIYFRCRAYDVARRYTI